MAKRSRFNIIPTNSQLMDQLAQMVDRKNRMQAYFNRVVYNQYKNAQRKRWMTENESEGTKWKALNPRYKEYKKRKFAEYKGGGRKMLIATGELVDSVIGPKGSHKKVATDKSITISWSTPYASYVDEVREFSEFGEKTMEEIYDGLAKFLIEGTLDQLGRI